VRSGRSATIGIAIVAVVALTIVWLRRERVQRSVATEPQAVPSVTLESSKPAAPQNSAEVEGLKARLAAEKQLREQAEAEAAALRQKVAPMQSNVVVSLGKVEDLGKRAGALLSGMGELNALATRDPATLTAEEKRRLLELQREHAKLLGALPEIVKFQDSPDDYGRFFKSMLQQAAGLNDAQATQVEGYMRQRAMEMNQLGLNAGKEPTDPKLEEQWEERRDQFNEQTAEGLKGVLPPGAAEKAGFSKELMEFLEMDFDKVAPQAAKAQ
jgi:hypothetical protein